MKSNPLRVMVLANSLNTGGAERFASGLLQWLDASGIQIHLAVLRPDIAYPLPDATQVHLLDYRSPRHLARTVVRLRRTLRRVRPDLLLGVSSSVNVVAGLALGSMRRRPAWIARVDITLRRSDLWLRRLLLGQLHRLADRVVANSHGLRRSLTAASPWLKHRLLTLHNPVDFDRIETLSHHTPCWRRSGDIPLLMTAGRACQGKRWDILLQAFDKLTQSHAAELVICGDGPQLGLLRDLADSMGLSGRVHFLGRCDNPFAIMAQADLYLLSSEAEGLPNALIEAQGLGVCAVATRCPFGPDEIVIHGETGLLTAVNDSPSLAEAMGALLSDEALRKQMGAKARERVKGRFDFAARSREWELLIREVAGGRDMGA